MHVFEPDFTLMLALIFKFTSCYFSFAIVIRMYIFVSLLKNFIRGIIREEISLLIIFFWKSVNSIQAIGKMREEINNDQNYSLP